MLATHLIFFNFLPGADTYVAPAALDSFNTQNALPPFYMFPGASDGAVVTPPVTPPVTGRRHTGLGYKPNREPKPKERKPPPIPIEELVVQVEYGDEILVAFSAGLSVPYGAVAGRGFVVEAQAATDAVAGGDLGVDDTTKVIVSSDGVYSVNAGEDTYEGRDMAGVGLAHSDTTRSEIQSKGLTDAEARAVLKKLH